MRKLLIILLCLPVTVFGQLWTFGGADIDRGHSVQQTSDGGYIITGATESFGNGGFDVYLIKSDVSGNQQWTQTFGGISYDIGFSVQQTSDGGYIINGTTESFGNGNYDIYLIKTDSNGNEQWTQTFGGIYNDNGRSVRQTNDGGYIICGTIGSTSGTAGNDIYLIKTDGSGNEQWTQTFGASYSEKIGSVQQTSDGGYIITGSTKSFGNGDYDIYLIKTDVIGNEQWTQTFGGSDIDRGYSGQQTSDGGYIITGFTESFGNGNGYMDVCLIKTDGNGNEQWIQTFGGLNNDYGNSVQQTSDGGYIICGSTTTGNGYTDLFLIKTDVSGNGQWNKIIDNGPGPGNSVQQTTDGGYVICGTISSGANSEDVYVIKSDGSGNVTSTLNIHSFSKRKLIKVVDILGRETKFKYNSPFIDIYDDGTIEKKITID